VVRREQKELSAPVFVERYRKDPQATTPSGLRKPRETRVDTFRGESHQTTPILHELKMWFLS